METVAAPIPLSVQNVQHLATKNLDVIPSRYIRPELMTDVIKIDEGSMIPIIDLSKLSDDQCCQDELEKFHLACKDWGFFQLINHGLPQDALENVKRDVTEFFKQPLEVKKEFSQQPVYGQALEGYGQAFVFSDEQKLDWGDMLYFITQPEVSRNMKLWPTSPHTFRETIIKYSVELQKIKICVMASMAKNLGIEIEQFTNMFEKGMQSMRFNYYPPCVKDDKVLGISPHSDATGITFLIQVNHVHGLQIRHEGHWVPVVLTTDAILVNIGDVLEILSNGKYKSVEHRVVINQDKERISVAAFHEVNDDVMIGPLPELIKNGEGKCYKSLSNHDYTKFLISEKLDGKTLLERMKLKN